MMYSVIQLTVMGFGILASFSYREFSMSATDHLYFSAQVKRYKTSYVHDGDEIRYVTNVSVAAANVWLAEKNELRKKMGKAGLVLPTALSASSPFFMAAMDAVAANVHCPVDKRMSAVEFLKHLSERIQVRYDSEYVKPAKDALKTVHDALQSLGLVRLDGAGVRCRDGFAVQPRALLRCDDGEVDQPGPIGV
jgi:hypothetical protein